MGSIKILSIFISLIIFNITKAEDNADKCCTTVRIETTGVSNSTQSARMGLYERVDTFFERPVYLHQNEPEYLFYMGGRARGLWMIGPEVGTFSGGLANRADKTCVEEVDSTWKFADGTSWIKDPLLKVSCEKDATECFYSDNSYLEGKGNDLVTIQTATTGQCIDRCVQTWGCRYWTVEKIESGESLNICTLKKWKGQLVHREGFISGSLPSACYDSSPSSSDSDSDVAGDRIAKERHCAYKDLEFVGSDLKTIESASFDECKTACSQYKECSFFTITKTGCILKGKNVEIRKTVGVISGATDDICREIQVQQKSREDAKQGLYDENEINGKFRIVSESWKKELEDPDSKEFKEISTTLKDGLAQALSNERQLSEQAEFNVDIVSLKKGSVVCNFKIRYVLKEGFAAVPFRINPSNVTGALDKTFQFRRGILFQRFVIASGSFLASSPVDHCDAKGCSHKCAYDYDLEDYMCTCPKTFTLDPADNRTCIGKLPEDKVAVATTLSPITISLLPTDCLWSEWTDWSQCSEDCGPGSRVRTRKVYIPERNGGACEGEAEETFECNQRECTEEDNKNKISESNTVRASGRDKDIPRAFSLDIPTTTEGFQETTILSQSSTQHKQLEKTDRKVEDPTQLDEGTETTTLEATVDDKVQTQGDLETYSSSQLPENDLSETTTIKVGTVLPAIRTATESEKESADTMEETKVTHGLETTTELVGTVLPVSEKEQTELDKESKDDQFVETTTTQTVEIILPSATNETQIGKENKEGQEIEDSTDSIPNSGFVGTTNETKLEEENKEGQETTTLKAGIVLPSTTNDTQEDKESKEGQEIVDIPHSTSKSISSETTTYLVETTNETKLEKENKEAQETTTQIAGIILPSTSNDTQEDKEKKEGQEIADTPDSTSKSTSSETTTDLVDTINETKLEKDNMEDNENEDSLDIIFKSSSSETTTEFLEIALPSTTNDTPLGKEEEEGEVSSDTMPKTSSSEVTTEFGGNVVLPSTTNDTQLEKENKEDRETDGSSVSPFDESGIETTTDFVGIILPVTKGTLEKESKEGIEIETSSNIPSEISAQETTTLPVRTKAAQPEKEIKEDDDDDDEKDSTETTTDLDGIVLPVTTEDTKIEKDIKEGHEVKSLPDISTETTELVGIVLPVTTEHIQFDVDTKEGEEIESSSDIPEETTNLGGIVLPVTTKSAQTEKEIKDDHEAKSSSSIQPDTTTERDTQPEKQSKKDHEIKGSSDIPSEIYTTEAATEISGIVSSVTTKDPQLKKENINNQESQTSSEISPGEGTTTYEGIVLPVTTKYSNTEQENSTENGLKNVTFGEETDIPTIELQTTEDTNVTNGPSVIISNKNDTKPIILPDIHSEQNATVGQGVKDDDIFSRIGPEDSGFEVQVDDTPDETTTSFNLYSFYEEGKEISTSEYPELTTLTPKDSSTLSYPSFYEEREGGNETDLTTVGIFIVTPTSVIQGNDTKSLETGLNDASITSTISSSYETSTEGMIHSTDLSTELNITNTPTTKPGSSVEAATTSSTKTYSLTENIDEEDKESSTNPTLETATDLSEASTSPKPLTVAPSTVLGVDSKILSMANDTESTTVAILGVTDLETEKETTTPKDLLSLITGKNFPNDDESNETTTSSFEFDKTSDQAMTNPIATKDETQTIDSDSSTIINPKVDIEESTTFMLKDQLNETQILENSTEENIETTEKSREEEFGLQEDKYNLDDNQTTTTRVDLLGSNKKENNFESETTTVETSSITEHVSSISLTPELKGASDDDTLTNETTESTLNDGVTTMNFKPDGFDTGIREQNELNTLQPNENFLTDQSTVKIEPYLLSENETTTDIIQETTLGPRMDSVDNLSDDVKQKSTEIESSTLRTEEQTTQDIGSLETATPQFKTPTEKTHSNETDTFGNATTTHSEEANEETEDLFTTTQSSSAKPKRISVGDVLIPSSTTELNFQVTEENIETTTDTMYPMTDEDQITTKPNIKNTGIIPQTYNLTTEEENKTEIATVTNEESSAVDKDNQINEESTMPTTVVNQSSSTADFGRKIEENSETTDIIGLETTTELKTSPTDEIFVSQRTASLPEDKNETTSTTETSTSQLNLANIFNGTQYQIFEEAESTTAYDAIINLTSSNGVPDLFGNDLDLFGQDSTSANINGTEEPETTTFSMIDAVVKFVTSTLSDTVSRFETTTISTLESKENDEQTTSGLNIKLLPEEKHEEVTVTLSDESDLTTVSNVVKTDIGEKETSTTATKEAEDKNATTVLPEFYSSTPGAHNEIVEESTKVLSEAVTEKSKEHPIAVPSVFKNNDEGLDITTLSTLEDVPKSGEEEENATEKTKEEQPTENIFNQSDVTFNPIINKSDDSANTSQNETTTVSSASSTTAFVVYSVSKGESPSTVKEGEEEDTQTDTQEGSSATTKSPQLGKENETTTIQSSNNTSAPPQFLPKIGDAEVEISNSTSNQEETTIFGTYEIGQTTEYSVLTESSAHKDSTDRSTTKILPKIGDAELEISSSMSDQEETTIFGTYEVGQTTESTVLTESSAHKDSTDRSTTKALTKESRAETTVEVQHENETTSEKSMVIETASKPTTDEDSEVSTLKEEQDSNEKAEIESSTSIKFKDLNIENEATTQQVILDTKTSKPSLVTEGTIILAEETTIADEKMPKEEQSTEFGVKPSDSTSLPIESRTENPTEIGTQLPSTNKIDADLEVKTAEAEQTTPTFDETKIPGDLIKTSGETEEETTTLSGVLLNNSKSSDESVATTSKSGLTTTPSPSVESRTAVAIEGSTIVPMLDLTTSKLVIVDEENDISSTTDSTTISYAIEDLDKIEETTSSAQDSLEPEEKFVMMDDSQNATAEGSKNQTLHTLKCHPSSTVDSEPGTIPMECQDEATSVQPIIVLISAEGLDLESISKNNIKIVVKEFMLMEMQQRLEAPKK